MTGRVTARSHVEDRGGGRYGQEDGRAGLSPKPNGYVHGPSGKAGRNDDLKLGDPGSCDRSTDPREEHHVMIGNRTEILTLQCDAVPRHGTCYRELAQFGRKYRPGEELDRLLRTLPEPSPNLMAPEGAAELQSDAGKAGRVARDRPFLNFRARPLGDLPIHHDL